MYAQVQHTVDPRAYGAYAAQTHRPANPPQPTSHWPPAQYAYPAYPTANAAQAAPVQSFPAPPAPPGVSLQAWQTGRWIYNGAAYGQQPYGSKPAAAYPPPSAVGWNVHAGWGVPAQYYHPTHLPQKQRDPSYWNTQLTNNGLMLEGMDKPKDDTSQGESSSKPARTPWVWAPQLPDDEPSHTVVPTPAVAAASSSRAPNVVSTAAPAANSQAPASVSMPDSLSRNHHPQQRSQPVPAPAIEPESPALYVEDPAQRRARETAPRMYANGPMSSASASAAQQAQQQQQQQTSSHVPTRAATAMRPSVPTSQTLSSASAQAAQQAQRSHSVQHVPSPHVQPPTSSHTQESAQPHERPQMLPAPRPSRPGEAAYTEVRELRPTFSPQIIRTPGHYDRGSNETPRASESANPPNQAGAGLQRSQTLPDLVNPSSSTTTANGLTRRLTMPSTSHSTKHSSRGTSGLMLSNLANFAEEPEELLSPLIDTNPSLFGGSSSDVSESSGSSTVSEATVVDEQTRGMSTGRAADLLRKGSLDAGGSVPRAERVNELGRASARERESSGSSSGSARDREHRRERQRDRERESERERDRESRRREREGDRTRSQSRYRHDPNDSNREGKRQMSQSSRSPNYPFPNSFYASPANGAEPSRMARSTSHSSEDANAASPQSSHHGTPYSQHSTASSSSHGTPASTRRRTSSLAYASNPPSLQPSPNRSHFPGGVPSPHVAGPQQPSPAQQQAHHSAQTQHRSVHTKTPSPNMYPTPSPTKGPSSAQYAYPTAQPYASVQATATPPATSPYTTVNGGQSTQHTSTHAQPAAANHTSQANGTIANHTASQATRPSPSRQASGYTSRGADIYATQYSSEQQQSSYSASRSAEKSKHAAEHDTTTRASESYPSHSYASNGSSQIQQLYSSASATAAAYERETTAPSRRRTASGQEQSISATTTPAKVQASPPRHASGPTTPLHQSYSYPSATQRQTSVSHQHQSAVATRATPAVRQTSSSQSYPYPHPSTQQRQSQQPQTSYRKRKGFWNRRGDYLTQEGFIVLAPAGQQYPPELSNYPEPGNGFLNHKGGSANHPGYRELPEPSDPGKYMQHISYV